MKVTSSIISICIILFLSSSLLTAQVKLKDQMQKTLNGKYLYKESIKKLHNFESVFQEDEESHREFLSFNKYRKRAKRAGLTSLVSLGLTAGLISRAFSGEYFEGGYLGLAILTGGLASFSGIIGITSKKKSSNYKKKLLGTFNDRSLSLDSSKNQMGGKIVIHSNAIGFIYSFN